MNKPWLPFLILISCNWALKSQEMDSTLNEPRVRVAGFPVAGYSPETRIIGGVYSQLLAGQAEDARPSGMGLAVLVSRNLQYSLNLIPDIWFAQDRYRIAGELKWQHWPDRFYGIGSNTRKEDGEYYISRIAGIKLDLQKRIRPSVYAGILMEVENNRIIEYDTVDHAVLPSGTIPGSDRSLISGIGLGAAWDTRDNILLPTSGEYLQFRFVWFNRAMGSTHPHTKWIVDLRKYMEFGNRHLLYIQVYGKFLPGREIPFRNMALLGGDKLLRGYFRGRYRDQDMVLAQAEYHSPPLWRISLVAFAGAGEVFNGNSGPLSVKPAGGIGLRYRLFRDRQMNLRMDAAAGLGDRGLYLSILEAF